MYISIYGVIYFLLNTTLLIMLFKNFQTLRKFVDRSKYKIHLLVTNKTKKKM